MSSSNSPISLLTFSLFFFLFLHAATAADPLYHFCFNKENYTSNTNLNELLNRLSIKVPPTGFGVATTGQGESRVNGLGLCRGDVSTADCKMCVVDAGKELQSRCPNNKGAVIWYDNCLVKYSDKDFFGEIDSTNKFYKWNVQDVEVDHEYFDKKVKELLSSLSDKASAISKLYATGELALETGSDPKLYGLAQCTRDLNGKDCKKCLDESISLLPNFSSGKRGGRVVGGSCNVRYELYPIVDDQKK